MPIATTDDGRFALAKLTMAVHDLASWTRAARETDDLVLMRFLEDYYSLVDDAVRRRGGRVVKHIGDAVLTVFPPESASDAIDAMTEIRAGVPALARTHGVPVQAGHAHVHLATVAHGELGPPHARHYDVIGAGVNHTFLLGARRGAGIHVSEAVYRQLPNERRGAWEKDKPPAVYSLSE